jgi:D-serine deaminase-like pyridoxal phosphate-dependent protein
MPDDHQKLETLQTPCLLLDGAKVHANVARMKSHLGRLGAAFTTDISSRSKRLAAQHGTPRR